MNRRSSSFGDRPRVVVCGSPKFNDKSKLYRKLDKLVKILERPIIFFYAESPLGKLVEQWAFERMFQYSKWSGDDIQAEMFVTASERQPSFCIVFDGPGAAEYKKVANKLGMVLRVIE